MQSHEIPSDQWVPFFNDLSKKHQGEHVKVEFLGRDFGEQHLPNDPSLVGISVDPPTGTCKIDVMVEDAGHSSVAHEFAHPIHVYLSQDESGKDAAVEIETYSGPCTLLRFQSTDVKSASARV
jgi:hypothetical protein